MYESGLKSPLLMLSPETVVPSVVLTYTVALADVSPERVMVNVSDPAFSLTVGLLGVMDRLARPISVPPLASGSFQRMFPRRNRQRQRIPKRIQHVRLTCLIFCSGHTPSSSMSTWGKYGKSKYPRQEFPC